MPEITIDGQTVSVGEGATILDAANKLGIDTPTLCYSPNLTPVNVCRVCVVELEGSRVLVPACSRPAEDGMVVSTDSERVQHSRRMVLEFLGSSVDVSLSTELGSYMADYGAESGRYGDGAATAGEPVKVQDDLYVRDYERCVLCYKCGRGLRRRCSAHVCNRCRRAWLRRPHLQRV